MDHWYSPIRSIFAYHIVSLLRIKFIRPSTLTIIRANPCISCFHALFQLFFSCFGTKSSTIVVTTIKPSKALMLGSVNSFRLILRKAINMILFNSCTIAANLEKFPIKPFITLFMSTKIKLTGCLEQNLAQRRIN